MSRPTKDRIRLLMRLVGPLTLVWVLYRFGDFDALFETLQGADAWPLILALLLTPVVIHAKVWRWQLLLREANVTIGLTSAYRAFLPSLYLGLITPGRVGDALRVTYLSRDHEVPYADGLAVSVMDRLADVYVLLAFVCLGIGHLAGALAPELSNAAWLMVALVALLPLSLFSRRVAEPLAQWLYGRLASGSSHEGLRSFFASLRKQLNVRLALPLAATVVAFLLNYLQAWLVALGLGIALSFSDVASLVAISSLLSLLPISISGLGVRESFFALVFPALGLSATLGITFGLGVFATIYLMALAVGFVGWQLWPPTT